MTPFSQTIEFHGVSATDGRQGTESYMCTVRNPIYPKQFHEIRNSRRDPVAGEDVIVFWESGEIDLSCSGDLLEFGVDDVELVFSDVCSGP
jgi:hypothetical protein